MKTITQKVYEFTELSEKGKERARQDQEQAFGYPWADEALESLQKLAAHFGGKLTKYEIDFFDGSPSYARFDMPDGLNKDEIKALLDKLGDYDEATGRGYGECELTGFCADSDAVDGFRTEFLQGATDLNDLMQAAFKTWIKAAQNDCDGIYSDEGMADTCEANEYYFFENGELAPTPTE
jgi:hypothetical protein